MARKVFLFISLCFAAASANIDAERIDSLSEYASSAVLGKDDAPVSLSGDFMVRMRNHNYYEFAPVQTADRRRTFFESGLSLALGVNPNSFVSFWGNLFLPMDFSGYYVNRLACSPNSISESAIANDGSYACKLPYHHSTDFYSSSMQENITVGMDLRGGEFAAELKAGGVLWTNTSPLTVWERQFTPQYVSQFETYEWERTVSMYYKEKSFSPVTEGGRAFWSNRSFGGLLLDVYKMPFGLHGQLMYSQTQDDDQGTRDGLRAMSNQLGEVEGLGTLDFRSDVVMARLAKKDIGNMVIGANFLNTFNDRDIIYEKPGIFFNVMGETKLPNDPRLIDYTVGSFDIRGNINQNFYIHLDVAVSVDDSIRFKRVPQVSGGYEQDEVDTKHSDGAFAVYLKAQSKYGIPLTSEIAYIAPDFYSPYGMTDYSRNRTWRKDQIPLGAGAYRYSANLAGANVKFEPQFNRGRFNFMYSQHRQVEKGADIIVLPYRLNGRAMWEATTQWSKYNPGVGLLVDKDDGSSYDYYRYRAGGGRNTNVSMIGSKYTQTNLSGGTWEMWEYFGNYDSAQEAAEGTVTKNAKWSSVISIDMGYDIGHWFGTDRNIMLAANTALSGISTSIAPLPYSEKATDLLWGWYFQAEPTFAITPNLHGLLIAGVELFRAPNAYGFSLIQDLAKNQPAIRVYELMPINYRDLALGAGFDWDFAPRAGLHVRYKWATHDDETNSINNWKGHFVGAETKVWF